jgi:hypothetical protein
MKVLSYTILIAILVPMQSVVMSHFNMWTVKPDLGFIAVSLIGLFAGELEGLVVGLMLGWVMSMFSAEHVLLSMLTKGGVGYAAGLVGRQVVALTPVALMLGLLGASCIVGLWTALSMKMGNDQDIWWAIRAIVLPQAVYDAIIGGTLYWLMWSRLNIQRWATDYRV